MKKQSNMWGVILSFAIIAIGAFVVSLFIPPKYSVRHKMIVEVETPDGVVSGSAVREFVFQGQPKASLPSIIPAEGSSGYSFLRGEAVYVDLGEGRSLIALLSGAGGGIAYTKRIPREVLECRDVQMILCLDSANIYPEEAEITFEKRFPFGLPLLVTFGDLDDPTSMATVDPDDIAASFGEGYALKRITVQITDEPVTTGLNKQLGWLNRANGVIATSPIPDSQRNGLSTSNKATIYGSAFSIGVD